jgi:hypothetical protein
VDTVSTLLLRTIPDRRAEPDDGGLGLLTASGCDRVVDSVEVATVTSQRKDADILVARYLSPSSTRRTCQP